MSKYLTLLRGPLPIIGLFALAILFVFLQTTIFPMDDHFAYQQFIEALASGRVDLSIPGFHGADILAVPLHWILRSPLTQIYFQISCAILLPFVAYFAGLSLFRERMEALLFAAVLTMMPFLQFVALRGWTGPSFFVLLLGAIALARKHSVWAGVLLAFAILTKPFALAALPLLIMMNESGASRWKKHRGALIVIAIPALYVVAQYLQVGHIIVGSHSGLNEANVWQGPVRIILNLAHALQILFSVHNYYFPDPALTGPGNMMHTTPLLVFLGLFALLSPNAEHHPPHRRALLLGALIGIGLNVLLDHMDHFYMEAGVLMLIIAAIPMLQRFPLWLPLVLATLHFQWLYFYLQYREVFGLEYSFFVVPALVDAVFVVYCMRHQRAIRGLIRTF